MTTPEPHRVIETGGLVKHYGTVRAVGGVDVTVAEAEIYALLGLNGAGKTTMIRMLLGMIAPTSGTVRLFGMPVSAGARQVWSQVGYLVETPAAYPELTVTENLNVVARLKQLPTAAVTQVIGQLGLGQYARRRSRDLSLGNQQRLGLAKALLGRPRLLILDEPANGLDPAGVTEIRGLLKTLAAQGTTILLSSHILGEVAKLATRIGIIHEGRMVTEIPAGDLPQHVRRTLSVACRDHDAAARVLRQAGLDPAQASDGTLAMTVAQAVDYPDDIATLLVQAGCPPTHLVVEHEDLESLFLRLTGASS